MGSWLATHTVVIPAETMVGSADGAGFDEAFGYVCSWVHERRLSTRDLVYAVERHIPSDGTRILTNDPLYAAVMAAAAEGGWTAARRVVELIEAGANHTGGVP